MTSRKYYAYVRKSSEAKERQALSIPRQKREIRERFGDLEIEFVEEERSAFKTNNRPEFSAMLERMAEERKVGLIAWHPDRLSRNEIDAARITDMVGKGVIDDLRFCAYTFENTPEGIMMLQFVLNQSQYESAKKSQAVKAGLLEKARLGHPPYPAIVGYKNTLHLEKGTKKWVKDPQRFEKVRTLWDLMLTGKYTPAQLTKVADEELGLTTRKRKSIGGKPVSRSGMYRLFEDRTYTGMFEYPRNSGEWHQGKFPPLISEREYQTVQRRLNQSFLPKRSLRSFRFRGLFKCGQCHAGITAERKRRIRCGQCKMKFSCLNRNSCPRCGLAVTKMNRSAYEYVFYRCTRAKPGIRCRQPSVEEKKLWRQIRDLYCSFGIPDEFMSWARAELKKTHHLEVMNRKRRLQETTRKLGKLQTQREQLIQLRLSDELTPQEFAEAKDSLNKEIGKLESRLKEKQECPESNGTMRLLTIGNSGLLNFELDRLDNIGLEISELVEEGSKPILMDKKAIFSLTKQAKALQRLSAVLGSIHKGFETRKSRLTEAQIHRAYSLNAVVLREWDDLRNP